MSVVSISLGVALVVAGLGTLPEGWLTPTAARTGGRTAVERGIPAVEAVWVSAQGSTGTSGWLRAGNVEGGAVTYLKFEIPANAGPAAARLELTAAQLPLPARVELAAVSDTSWSAQTMEWHNAPVRGPVLQRVQPTYARRLSFELGELTGPGTYAFALTVPPDLNPAVFIGIDGGPDRPVLTGLGPLPPGHPTSRPAATSTGLAVHQRLFQVELGPGRAPVSGPPAWLVPDW